MRNRINPHSRYVRDVPLKQWRTWFHNMDVTDKTTDICHFKYGYNRVHHVLLGHADKIMHHVIFKLTVRFPGIIWNLMWLNRNVYFLSFLVNQFRARDQFHPIHYYIRPLRTIWRQNWSTWIISRPYLWLWVRTKEFVKNLNL